MDLKRDAGAGTEMAGEVMAVGEEGDARFLGLLVEPRALMRSKMEKIGVVGAVLEEGVAGEVDTQEVVVAKQEGEVNELIQSRMLEARQATRENLHLNIAMKLAKAEEGPSTLVTDDYS